MTVLIEHLEYRDFTADFVYTAYNNLWESSILTLEGEYQEYRTSSLNECKSKFIESVDNYFNYLTLLKNNESLEFNEELFNEWIVALKYDWFPQGMRRLRTIDYQFGNEIHSYCCIGVAAQVAINNELIKEKYVDWDAPYIRIKSIGDLFGMNKYVEENSNYKLYEKLIYLNDTEHRSFEYIADYLESIRHLLK